ncbi:MAG: helix-turn-helix transcriptional regulator [Nanoarchaeota archaeon]|nr:helix-turn-helix transcriptional regulator [Nanoarchaeota archaeon]
MTNKERSIHYTKEDERIPFAAWLGQEKIRLGFTWKEMAELTGVTNISSYVYGKKGDQYLPSQTNFKEIVDALGYSVNDFETIGTKKGNIRQTYNKQEKLTEIAEAAIKRNFDIIRSPLVRSVAGENFYAKYGKGKEKMQSLVEDIHAIDTDRYGHLKYVPQKQNKGNNSELCSYEVDIITKTILKSTTNRDNAKRLPNGIIKKIRKGLKEKGFERTAHSIRYHINQIWYGTEKNIDPQKQVKTNQVESGLEKSTLTNKEKIIQIWRETYLKSHAIPLNDFAERFKDGNKKSCCTLESKLNRSIASSTKMKDIPRNYSLIEEKLHAPLI